MSLDPVFRQAQGHHGAGRLGEAERLYRKILAADPNHAASLHYLGILAHQLGRNDQAVELIRKAIAVRGGVPDFHSNLGVVLAALGRLEEAAAAYRQAVVLNPDYADAHANLAGVLTSLGQPAEAAVSLRRIAELRPDQAGPHANLGLALKALGRPDEAEAALRRAVALDPAHAAAHYNLAVVLQAQGALGEAVACFRLAVALNPDDEIAHDNLGGALLARGEIEAAAASYRRAIEIKPDFAEAHYNLGCVLESRGALEEGAASYARAVALNPNFAEAHHNLGLAHLNQRRLDEAAACFARALESRPDYAMAHNNLGLCFQYLDRLDEAEARHRRAIELTPDHAEAHFNLGFVLYRQNRPDEAAAAYQSAIACKPDFAEAYSNLLILSAGAVRWESRSALEKARDFGRMAQTKGGGRFSAWTGAAAPTRLKVGMVSGDLKDHPVGHFLEALLARIDPARLELVAYPTNVQASALTERIRPFFSAWRSLDGLSDEAAAKAIHDDGVHVLLDLAGHTAHNRLPRFAWKPAPVQASWLGYYATTGLAEMDYLIGDPHVTPPEEAGHFTERPWALPETYLCFTPPDLPVAVGPLPALSGQGVTFGCFNNLAKMNDAVVAVWAQGLLATPGSRLFLKTRLLNQPALCARTRARFAAHGVDPARLVLESEAPRAELLASYNRVDIALDPFPYPGGTTSIEGLWMGVPFVTRRGDRFLAHIGEGIARNAGLADWIADDDQDYIARMVAHSADLARLAALRAGLRERVLASPLFDAPRFARHLEDALWGMWTNRRQEAP